MSDTSDIPKSSRGLRPDPWHALRSRSPARVALGRAGGSLPTAELLRFAFDHAEARDAVHEAFAADDLVSKLKPHGLPVMAVRSQAADKNAGDTRTTYLRFPERGRRLNDDDRRSLQAAANDGCDVAIILGDGLSATAANGNGPAFVGEVLSRLQRLRVGPIVVARQARVALQDDIGHALKARAAVIILGERPGLGTADSLGAYLVFAPKPGNTDAHRNCVSNIRPQGLPLAAAAETLAYLLDAALHRGLSGVSLKDDRPAAAFDGAWPNPALP